MTVFITLTLFAKLANAGIDCYLLNWIINYLSNRILKVKINNDLSTPFLATSGVPQGTIIGPLLFLFYIADAPKYCNIIDVKLKFFADDLKAYIIYPTSNHHSATTNLQAFTNKFAEWCTINKLKIAHEKCVTLYLGKNNPKKPYYICSNAIIATSSIRDLGIVTTSPLNWNEHIVSICKKANCKLFSLFKALRSNESKFLINMYTIYVGAYIRILFQCIQPIPCKRLKC